MIAPGRSLRFVTLPPGQDPDDLVRSGGAEAMETLLAKPEGLADRLWRHELDAEPLTTPEARAGLRRRLADLAQTIQDRDVREQYQAEFRRRFDELYARRQPPPDRPFRPARRGERGAPWQPQRPTSAQARTIGSTGIDRTMARALLAGLIRYPDLAARHAEAIGGLLLGDRALERLRDALLDAAFRGGALESEGLMAILEPAGLGSVADQLQRTNGLAFSFLRSNADSDRARRDLAAAIEVMAARPELDAALAAATERLMAAPDEEGFAEQRRLRAARDEADRSLAALAQGEDGAEL
jgi:DNA primase